MMTHPAGPELFILGQMSRVIRSLVALSTVLRNIPLLVLAIRGFSPKADPSWRMAFHLKGQLNQAFGPVSILGSSTAVLLWPIQMLRGSQRSRNVFPHAIFTPVAFLIVICGPAHPYVHGFGVIAVSQPIRFIGARVWLRLPPVVATTRAGQ
jgi:hypothetical protein